MKTKTRRRYTMDYLVGQYFHSWDGDAIRWQGIVMSCPQEGTYLVQLYEWVMGTEEVQILVPLSQMMAEHWTFYSTRKEWLQAYRKYDAEQCMKDLFPQKEEVTKV